MEFANLRGEIRRRCQSEHTFAKMIGMSSATLSQKLNGKRDWKRSEMIKSMEVLLLPTSSIYDYFFAE